MTSIITIKAESHDCEARELPVINGVPMAWESLDAETRKFGAHIVRVGDSLDMHVHSERAILVLEVHTAAKCAHPLVIAEPTNRDEGKCTSCGTRLTRQTDWKTPR